MAVHIKNITFDCTDLYRLAQFWSQLTGFAEDPANANAAEDPEALLLAPDGSLALLFVAGPDPKRGKNRVHLDLLPVARTRDQELDRVLGLGARVLGDHRRPDGTGWVVLADPEGNEFCLERSLAERESPVEQLARAQAAVSGLIDRVGADQWAAPTPCAEWTVARLVEHLIGLNLVFASLLADQPPPGRDPGQVEPDPAGAYRTSAEALVAAFGQPGVLQRAYPGPLGTATGADRLQIRLYDLLAHGWDLAVATGQPVGLLPPDLAEQSLAFVRTQLTDDARPGRFAPARAVADQAPAIERLAGFLGRDVAGTEPASPALSQDGTHDGPPG